MKSQEKLPFMRIEVENEFPDEHKKSESEVNSPCILNVVEKEKFLKWYSQNRNRKVNSTNGRVCGIKDRDKKKM